MQSGVEGGDSRSYRATAASRGHVLIPLETRSIRGGVWLYGAIRNASLLAHVLTGWLAGRNVRAVPGRDVAWTPPVAGHEFAGWLRDVEERLETRVKSWVVQLPSDRRRRRFNLLFLDDWQTPIAFAKFTANRPNSLAIAALSTFSSDTPDAFWVPTLVLEGRVEDLSFVVTSAAPNRPHRPASLTPERRRLIVNEIQQRLRDLVSLPFVAVHGDFGPWNVRQLITGEIAVFDWEETTGGVTAADELWHVICLGVRGKSLARAVTEVRAQLDHHVEEDIGLAAGFWLDRLNRPESAEVDHSISRPANLDAVETRIKVLLSALRDSTASG